MGEEESNDEMFNMPDMAEVEYQVALEMIVKMYHGLRTAGLPMEDTAAIVAAIMTRRLDA